MDITQISQDDIKYWNIPSYELKKTVFVNNFSLGGITTSNFNDKIEIIVLLCFLYQQLHKRDPKKFTSVINVIDAIFTESQHKPFQNYLEGLAVLCEDLLFGVKEIEKPGDFKNSQEIINRIKTIASQWMPF